jgi:cell division septation protein DedD
MEEQSSWRGHGFTFFVFIGIVVLSGIFFILGMLVGYSQGQKYAVGGAEAKKIAPSAAPTVNDLDFSEELQRNELPPLVVESAPQAEDPLEDALPSEPAHKGENSSPPGPAPAPTANGVVVQVEALGRASAALKLVDELKKLGFKAAIVPPSPGAKDSLYRVQVGPYADSAEANSAKRKLESAGYPHPIVKK